MVMVGIYYFPQKGAVNSILKSKKKNNKKDWLGPEEVTEYITFKYHAEVHTNKAVFWPFS